MNIESALFSRLNADTALTADLATYGSAKAIFTGHIPEGSLRPYVFIHGAISNEPSDAKNSRGRDVFARIDAVADATGSTIIVNRIAERMRALLHRYELAVTSFAVRVASVSGPTLGESDSTVYVRTLTLRLLAEES